MLQEYLEEPVSWQICEPVQHLRDLLAQALPFPTCQVQLDSGDQEHATLVTNAALTSLCLLKPGHDLLQAGAVYV